MGEVVDFPLRGWTMLLRRAEWLGGEALLSAMQHARAAGMMADECSMLCLKRGEQSVWFGADWSRARVFEPAGERRRV